MPDLPPAKRQTVVAATESGASGGYAELHAKTNFSFLEGASYPDELVARSVELGYAALAITDRNSLAGVVRAHVAAKPCKLKLLIGAEITPDDAPPLVLLATDRAAYGRLSRLITVGRRRAEKGQCRLFLDDLAEHAAGLLALAITGAVVDAADGATGHAAAARPTPYDDKALAHRHRQELGSHSSQPEVTAGQASSGTRNSSVDRALARYREIFGDRAYGLVELNRGPDDERRRRQLIELARRAGLPHVPAGDVHYHVPTRQPLHDVLTATRYHATVAAAGSRLFANAERHLKSPAEMTTLWADDPAALERTLEIAARCEFSLDKLRYEYPEELCPAGLRPIEHLARLTWAGARERYPAGVPDKVRQLIEYELQLIEALRYEAYFLTVWDLVRFARSRGILCQGRGSAANSAVCYALGVTSVDPARMDVLFERFISQQRNEPPDIDVDFEHERREEVLQYVYAKYGRERAGIAATVITYRTRSAVRDVGKALGLSLDRVAALSAVLDDCHDKSLRDERCREAGLEPASPLGRRFLALVDELVGFPRHLSQHVGGMVITRGPLCELVPIENAAMAERTVIQWDKDDLDALGLLKVDCLCLGMLTAIRKCFALVAAHHGRRLSLDSVPAEDAGVYEMVSRADTIGVFQIESRAQMSMLPRLRPRTFYDLVIEVAIVRPGPIQGDMVHPYLRRRAGEEAIEYPNEAIRAVLEKTLGVPIFQEQAMRLAVVAAGFTPGEADQLRRAMGAWRRTGIIEQFRQKLLDGMRRTGLSDEFAERVFQQVRGFGEYGFPESHAASFALLVYVSAWLKCYYPAAFTAALLNSQPMGFYAPAQLVRDAREHGVEVRPIDVNHSDWDCTLEPAEATPHDRENGRHSVALRLGLRMIRGLGETPAGQIVAARDAGRFDSLEELAERSHTSQAVLLRLARADACRSLGLDRRQALWLALAYRDEDLPLFAGQPTEATPDHLPPLAPQAEVAADYRTAGLSLRPHPAVFLRPALRRLRVVPAAELRDVPHGRGVRVAGLVLLRQRPSTARGIIFVTLEDETGQANLVIRPAVWERYHRAARLASFLLVDGRLERKDDVIHVVARRLEDLSERLQVTGQRSRDFR